MEDLKKKFIIDENLDEKRIINLGERLLPFVKVSKSGEVFILAEKAVAIEKVKLALTARYIANKLQPEIPSEINSDDISKFVDVPKNQAAARLNDLKDNKFAETVERGLFKVNPWQIGSFIDEMEAKYGRS